jgi:cobalt/nickel transport system permease protein
MSSAAYLDVGQMDDLGRLDSPVHRLDARVKALTTAVFIVLVMSFPRYEVSALVPFCLYPVALLALGRVPPGCILRKLLVAAPFVLAVGILNPWLDRRIVLHIGSWGVSGGWLSLASIALRAALTVSAALTLVACTGIYRLCAGLEQLGLPRLLAVQVQLLYRYLFVISAEGLRLRRAAEIRAPDRAGLPLRTYAALVGQLLLRSLDRAQRVHQAMVARGFTGHLRVLRPTRLRAADLAFLAGWTAFFVAARCWNLSRWLGALVTGDAA